jgi:hypothetical protein
MRPRESTERREARWHDQRRDAEITELSLDDDRTRPGTNGGKHVVVPVETLAAKRDEHGSPDVRAAVGDHALHAHAGPIQRGRG